MSTMLLLHSDRLYGVVCGWRLRAIVKTGTHVVKYNFTFLKILIFDIFLVSLCVREILFDVKAFTINIFPAM